MSISLISAAFKTQLDHSIKFVLVALCDSANEKLVCFPSIFALSEKTSLAERTVQRSLKYLIENGYVIRHLRTGRSTFFNIINPAMWPEKITENAELSPRHHVTPPQFHPATVSPTPATVSPHPATVSPTPATVAPITVTEPLLNRHRTFVLVNLNDHGKNYIAGFKKFETQKKIKIDIEQSEKVKSTQTIKTDPVQSNKKNTTRKKSGSCMKSSGWQLNAAMFEWANLNFPSWNTSYLQRLAEKFKDYWLANGREMKDWDASFRNWCRNDVRGFGGSGVASGLVNRGYESAKHQARRVVSEAIDNGAYHGMHIGSDGKLYN